MAQEQSKFTYDEWVGQVRPDPRNTDQLTLLQGYIGQSSESGHIRVYGDESLNNFVEIPEDAIVYSIKQSGTESPLGGSKLWVRSDAVVTYGDPKAANRPKSNFLEGDLMQQYATQYGGYDPAAGMGAYGGQTGQGWQVMATVPLTQCPTVLANQCFPKTVIDCPLRITYNSCFTTICRPNTCFKTVCGPQTCLPTQCVPQTCPIPIPGGGIPRIPVTIPPGGGPVVQQGGFMGGQPDTNYFGGYYGTFNPYGMY